VTSGASVGFVGVYTRQYPSSVILSMAWDSCASPVGFLHSLLTTPVLQLLRALYVCSLVALGLAESRYPQGARPLTAGTRPSSLAAHRGLCHPRGSATPVLVVPSFLMVALPYHCSQRRLRLVSGLRQRVARVLLRARMTLQRYRRRHVAIRVSRAYWPCYVNCKIALKWYEMLWTRDEDRGGIERDDGVLGKDGWTEARAPDPAFPL